MAIGGQRARSKKANAGAGADADTDTNASRERVLQMGVREVAGSEGCRSECAKLEQAKPFNDDLLGLGPDG